MREVETLKEEVSMLKEERGLAEGQQAQYAEKLTERVA